MRFLIHTYKYRETGKRRETNSENAAPERLRWSNFFFNGNKKSYSRKTDID